MAAVEPSEQEPVVASDHSASARHAFVRYLWLIGTIVPGAVFASWLAVHITGHNAFWWMTPVLTFVVVPLVDHLVGVRSDYPPTGSSDVLENDPFYRWATILYLPVQYLSLIFACWLWAGGGWVTMSVLDKVGLMVTVGIIGGVAINAAHELGHRHEKAERWLSKMALAQTWYGHFFVEHNRGHHKRVATVEDPASSRYGESVYHFVPRSMIGSLRSAWAIESRRWAHRHRSRWTIQNDILSAWLMSLALFTVLAVWFRPVVLPWLIGQAVIGFCLLEAVNYLEHYGLRRRKLPSGRYERVGDAHSWNSDTLIANVLLFHLQRHSDHHTNPSRRYQVLRGADEAPQLPSGYGGMLVLALIPPLWRRVMNPRVLAHYDGDIALVGLSPRDAERLRSGKLPAA